MLWAQLFRILIGEDIDSDDVSLGVTVLTSLGRIVVHDLAGPSLDADVSKEGVTSAFRENTTGSTNSSLLHQTLRKDVITATGYRVSTRSASSNRIAWGRSRTLRSRRTLERTSRGLA